MLLLQLFVNGITKSAAKV